MRNDWRFRHAPHLHFHVRPRRFGDALLRIYPHTPDHPDRTPLDALGAQLRDVLRELEGSS